MRSTNISRWLKTRHCEIFVPKFGRRTQKLPKVWKQIISIFGERTTILNFKMEKRPSNFYGANVDTLGVFQTESVLAKDSAECMGLSSGSSRREAGSCADAHWHGFRLDHQAWKPNYDKWIEIESASDFERGTKNPLGQVQRLVQQH